MGLFDQIKDALNPKPAEAARPAPGAHRGTPRAESSSAPGSTYTVAPGDTLESIAEHLGVDAGEFARANHIENPDLIYPGLVLGAPEAG